MFDGAEAPYTAEMSDFPSSPGPRLPSDPPNQIFDDFGYSDDESLADDLEDDDALPGLAHLVSPPGQPPPPITRIDVPCEAVDETSPRDDDKNGWAPWTTRMVNALVASNRCINRYVNF